MSKGVSKQCSILNYLRRTDEDLHELLQDLCIGKMLIPRKGSPGITFLRPDKALLKDIQDMASGDEPEAAIEALQSLVLLDNLANVKDFDDKKSDIPTYLRKKLPVVSADGKKVVLKNGAEIVPDKDFEARKDRGNISVYIISKALVPSDGPDADFSNAKVQSKKGGADLGATRQQLFEYVLKQFCESNRDPAMELLAAMHGWAETNKPELANVIAAKASGDTLATLAIVLQPYKANYDYLDDATLSAFKTAMYGENKEAFKAYTCFSRNPNAKELYEDLCKDSKGKFTDAANMVRNESKTLATKMGKLNAVRLLSEFYGSKAGSSQVTRSQLFAEAELRVLSATVLENSDGRYDCDELSVLYQRCNLKEPYMCADKDLMQSANLGFYYSTVYLIARSDALFHVPSTVGDSTSQIADDNVFINLNQSVGNLLAPKRAASASAIMFVENGVKH